MSIEIERTYLANRVPDWVLQAPKTKIEDYYFPTDMDLHPKLRLRRKGDLYEITKKSALIEGDASKQMETTIDLNELEFRELCQNSKRKVTKCRYSLKTADYLVDFDIFEGPLAGLLLVDFEFQSEAAMQSFVMPDYCGADVTQDDFIAGGMLAGKALKDIKQELEQLGYSYPEIEGF